MPYRDPWREAIRDAERLLHLGLSPRQVAERTRLPQGVVDGIAPPILRQVAEYKAVREAELAVEREHRKALREKYPCPMCGRGYGVAEGGVLTAFLNGAVQPVDSTDVPESSPFFRPYWAHCSTRRCIARLVFPRDSEEDALDAFVLGEWVRPHPFRSLEDGSEWAWTKAGLRNEVIHLLADHTTEQVEQLGFNPPAVERLANQLALRRMELYPGEAFDTTLMCPKCGGRGQFRKAVNPVTHRKTAADCWWRVGCPRCGARTVNSFPTRQQAQSAFETGDFTKGMNNEKKAEPTGAAPVGDRPATPSRGDPSRA